MAGKSSPPQSPVSLLVQREEIPLSRRESDEILSQRLKRRPSPPVGHRKREGSSQENVRVVEVTLEKKDEEDVGFGIEGGQDSLYVTGDDGIFISYITPGGAADKQGGVAVGDCILEVCGKSMDGVTCSEAERILESAPKTVKLKIDKGIRSLKGKKRELEGKRSILVGEKRRLQFRNRIDLEILELEEERERLLAQLKTCKDESMRTSLEEQIKINEENIKKKDEEEREEIRKVEEEIRKVEEEIRKVEEEIRKLEVNSEQALNREEESSTQFLREAVKKGYVHVTLVKVIVVGPAGVGKTCFMYLLLSKSPPSPEERESTGCAERSIRVIRVGKEGGEWNEISTQEFQEMIAEAIPILYEELKSKGKGIEELDKILSELEEEEEGERKEGEGEKDGKGEGEVEVDDRNDKEMGKEKNQMDKEVEKKEEKNESSSGGDSKAAIDRVIQKLTNLVSSGKKSHRLLDMELIYITDCGGQQAFWDLIPIFTYDTSATVFVHRLCEKLDEHPLNDVYKSGQRVGPSQRAILTTAEAFKTMLRGLHEGGKRSKIITVGTHRDLAAECEETPEEKNKKFAAIASPHFKDDVLYRDEGMKEVIFKVNTIDPKVDDRKEASKIRAVIEESAVERKIPIWWFILQLILEALAHKLGRDVLSKSECIHVSDSLGFSEGELDAALAFFDKLNIFLYKKDVLPNVVFTNAQVPLDKLSELVEEQYHLKAAEADPTKASGQAITGDWQKFRDNGILTLKFLKRFKAHYVEGIFTANDFLHLIKQLLVVAPLSAAETEYFFPAILDMTAEAHINRCLDHSRATKIAPLVVWFPTGWAPPGVYCCSICHLQSHSHWNIVPKPCTTSKCSGKDTQLRHVSRNCITFTKHGRPGSVTFIDNFSFFIACVNVNTSDMKGDELQEHCQAIRCELFAAVEAGLNNTHHTNSHPKDAFLCPRQSESCSSEVHVAHISDNGKRWICSENNDIFSNFTPDQTVWLRGQASTHTGSSSVPKMEDLANRCAVIIPDKWKQVAIQLGLSMGDIKAIHKDEDDTFSRFMAVFDHWQRSSCKPYTWKTLVNALRSRSVNEIKLADELDCEFC